VKLNNIPTRPLTKLIPVYNVDSTANDAGAITDIADIILRYENHSECTKLAVTRLGKQSLILGYNWLCNHNMEINLQTKEVKIYCYPLHPLVELKISMTQRCGSRRLPKSMPVGQERSP
jgi:hypothetical protein